MSQQQEAAMAIQDRVQAAVDQHLAAASAAHAQELAAVQQQVQQTLDRRGQVSRYARAGNFLSSLLQMFEVLGYAS